MREIESKPTPKVNPAQTQLPSPARSLSPAAHSSLLPRAAQHPARRSPTSRAPQSASAPHAAPKASPTLAHHPASRLAPAEHSPRLAASPGPSVGAFARTALAVTPLTERPHPSAPPLPFLPGSAAAARDHRRGRRDPYLAAIPARSL